MLDGVDERAQLLRRAAEVGIAEQDKPRRWLAAQSRVSRGGHVPALSVRASPAHDPSAGSHRRLRGAVGRRVVRHPHDGGWKGLAERCDRDGNPLDLVPRGDDHRDAGPFTLRRQRRLSCRPPVAQVEAHITGTVWKIEVGVGDEIDEGDTVVILESMKMEMPVEAEDAGTVTEVLVEEGQSVQEGDPLVALE